jgi:hypothetical protein
MDCGLWCTAAAALSSRAGPMPRPRLGPSPMSSTHTFTPGMRMGMSFNSSVAAIARFRHQLVARLTYRQRRIGHALQGSHEETDS